MGKYNDTKIVIIGFGFLMGYLYDCCEKFLGTENIRTNIIAVTADEATIEEKRKKYPFKIILSDNLLALREIKPDIILFAPPPSVAPKIIAGELKTYFKECKKKPDIYAFPPSPAGRYYLDTLGEDIFVCNILPNMVKEIGGRSLKGSEGFSTLTYPDGVNFKELSKKRLTDFLKPLGGTVEVSPENIMDVLASYVMIDLWPHRILNAAKLLGSESHKEVVKNPDMINEYIYEVSESIVKFLLNSGIQKEKASFIVNERNQLVFHLIGETEESDLVNDMLSHSTKGGVFEKGMNLHKIVIDSCTEKYLKESQNLLSDAIYSSLEIISLHGRNLAEEKSNESMHPGIHAVIFALYVRKIKELLNSEADGIIEDTVKKYGEQRGRRMRLRAEKSGYSGSMEDYMSFGEWTADEDSMEIRNVNIGMPAVTRVYKCPWVTEWKKFGFISEGEYYCRFVDNALVKGFNDSLELDINSIKSKGDEFCEFVWNGAELNGIKEIKKENKIMPWKYHIAHLMSCIKNSSVHGKEILDSINQDISVIYDINLSEIEEEYKNCDFNSI